MKGRFGVVSMVVERRKRETKRAYDTKNLAVRRRICVSSLCCADIEWFGGGGGSRSSSCGVVIHLYSSPQHEAWCAISI